LKIFGRKDSKMEIERGPLRQEEKDKNEHEERKFTVPVRQ
jgi:hypothetical protein